MKTDLWRLGHGQAEMRFPSMAMLRTFVVFREWLETWPWKETHVVDVGACVGSFALAVAQTMPEARLSIIEPWPDALAYLTDNLATQARMRATLHRLAASDRAGERLMVEGDKWGMSALGEGVGVMVKTVRLDDLLNRPVSLMKLDVEGHELDVLRGAQGIIARDHPRLILEMRPDMQKNGGHEPNELGEWLAANGYQYSMALTKQDYLYATEKEPERVK